MVIDLPTEAGQVPDLQQGDVRETANIGLTPKITNFSDSQYNHSNAVGGGATTHAAGYGSDHANVALNDTHRGSNGTNHANVVTNDTHVAGDGSDHANVALNDTHRADNSQAHSDYLLNTGDITTGAITFDDGTADSPAAIFINGSNHTATMVCQNTSGDLHISTNTGGIELAPGDSTIDFGGSQIVGALIAADHGTASTDQIVNVSYGTSSTPPTATDTTIGSLYVQYIA